MDNHSVAFITCVNDDELYQECIKYIDSLNVPDGYKIEKIAIRDAKSATSGYNNAMLKSNSKYKVYLHQDTFIINKNVISDCLKIFDENANVGMIGVVGAETIPTNAVWWESNHKSGKVYESSTGKMELLDFNNSKNKEEYTEVQAIDGLIMITQYDVKWREDIFDGWHFYDISQSTEFRNSGYKIGIPMQEQPWCVHDSGVANIQNGYEIYRKCFLKTYSNSIQFEEDIRERTELIIKTLEEDELLLNIKKKIYIMCPANLATGGPELLHQLCYKLNKLNYEAYMFYFGQIENPVHERYKEYNNKYVTKFFDSKENIIIIPETNVCDMLEIKESKLIIWWLSVDNFFIHLSRTAYTEKQIFESISKRKEKNSILHLAQSQYAVDYLINNKIKSDQIYYLSDYLNDAFIKESQKKINKYPNVLYNPKKGFEFTSKLIKASPELNWIKLENYTPQEMAQIMKRSMVYIDFGNHPGKDRIPREAAICGCCIITGQRGSASNSIDVPIMNEFKYKDIEENIYPIVEKIKYITANYENEINKFEEYRNIILNEEERFEKDTERVFFKISYEE